MSITRRSDGSRAITRLARVVRRLGVGALIGLIAPCGPAYAVTTERISVTSSEAEANADSPGQWGYQGWLVGLSEHARYVAFASDASNLVTRDTNRVADIFVRDRKRNTTTRISVSSSGAQADGPSFGLAMTPDARFIAFNSRASNLVRNDRNGAGDIFVHDRRTQTTTRVSVSSNGAESESYASAQPAISDDGRFVAFASDAGTLVARDVNPYQDVFIHDRHTGKTTLESVRSDGMQGDSFSGAPDISADGRFIAFASAATNFATAHDASSSPTGAYVRDRLTGTTQQISAPGVGAADPFTAGSVHVAARAGVLLLNRGTDVLAVGLNSNRQRCIACWTEPGDARWSYPGGISADGRLTTFHSEKSNLVPRDTNRVTDVFIRGWLTQRAIRVSVSARGFQSQSPSTAAGISPDGRYVAFISRGSDVVRGDTNRRDDIFVRGPLPRRKVIPVGR